MGGKITTAMVLAAGHGSRMRPLTNDIPKPMVQLAGRALIDHVLARLADAQIKRAVVNLHYKADVLEQHLKTCRRPEIVLSDERDALLDTGGGIARALPLLWPEPFLVHNSDSVWIETGGSNLSRLVDAWDLERMDCLMLLAPVGTSLGYSGAGDFVMANDGSLVRRPLDGHAPLVFAGVSIMQPELFDGLSCEAFSLNVAWDRAIARRRLFGVPLEGTWMHVGTPDALLEAERLMASHRSDVT